MIGNILEHYDTALFALLAPFLAPLFFDTSDPLTALILTYSMLPLGILMRPLGSLFFGWIGDRVGRVRSLFYSLMGMSIVTVSMGFLPTYLEVGAYAPLLLAAGRVLQSFFTSGESVGGAIFVLENTSLNKRNLLSSIYDASSVVGILSASALVTFFCWMGNIEKAWRFLFWFGGLTAILGVFLRLKARDGSEFLKAVKIRKIGLLQVLREHKGALFSIIIVSGFSYTTYCLAFTLMNGYIPVVTLLSSTEVMQVNTILLLVDMILLPCFGYLAIKIGKEKVMSSAAFCAVVCAVPLFYLLERGTLERVIVVRFTITMLGIAFASTYHAWALERVCPEHRFTILSLGAAIGSQVIGAPTAAICLWLYQKTGWVPVPALYFMVTAAMAGCVIVYSKKRQELRA